jgi:hypothetical protein
MILDMKKDMREVFGHVVIVLARIAKQDIDGLYDDAVIVGEETVWVQHIWMYFTGTCCPKLVGRPKIFFYLDPGSSDQDAGLVRL